jgi:two-component system, OmpR family, sensor histidine kinase KdpD
MNQRPDPQELLHRVQIEEKKKHWGRLKVFLGYASRVGKSYRMFDEGRRRKERGQDVVVAAVQSKLTPDLEQILETLESIPPLKMNIGHRTYEVLNIPAVLKRRPQVCLVDELGYDNPPGSRNRTRWQDVRELLRNGITVVTAVNLQYIHEQQDAVERITGKRAGQTVPEAFLRAADEIVLVDAALEDLQSRDASKPHLDNSRLFELRELALLLAADVVDKQLHRYLQSHGIDLLIGSQERILVCITPRSSAPAMLESGRRNADRFHCDLLAVYVEQKNLSRPDQGAIESNIELARQLGAEVHSIDGQDSVSAILEFARSHGVTQLFVGHSIPGGWRGVRSWYALDKLIRNAKGMDVRVFPHVTQ